MAIKLSNTKEISRDEYDKYFDKNHYYTTNKLPVGKNPYNIAIVGSIFSKETNERIGFISYLSEGTGKLDDPINMVYKYHVNKEVLFIQLLDRGE